MSDEVHAEGCDYPETPCQCDEPPDVNLYNSAWPSAEDLFRREWKIVVVAVLICALFVAFAITCVVVARLMSTEVNGF